MLSMDDVKEDKPIELSMPDSSASASATDVFVVTPDPKLDDVLDLSKLSQDQPKETNNGGIGTARGEETTTGELPKVEITPSAQREMIQTQQVNADREGELVTLTGLMLVVLAGAMFYVGTVMFASDSLLFFGGIFLYMLVAPPGTYAQGKSKMVSFTKEVAIAFALCFCLFMALKTLLPPDADQAKLLTILLTVLGVKLVFYPYYNFKQED